MYDASLIPERQTITPIDPRVCGVKRAPERPQSLTGGEETLVFVLRDIVLDQREDRWRTIGLDLDGFEGVNCAPTDETARSCEPAREGDPNAEDGEAGIDNIFGRTLTSLILEYETNLATSANGDQTLGRSGMLLQLSGYNGGESSSVRAVLARTLYGYAEGTEGGGAGVPAPLPQPAWDGRDRWWVANTDFTDGDANQPKIVDEAAYIANRQVVMRLPERSSVVMPWPGRRLNIVLSDGRLTGSLSADGQRLDNVTISGRWSVADAPAAFLAAGECPDTVPSQVYNDRVPEMADVRADIGTDGTGETCDALSVGLQFTGYRATLAGLDTPTAEADPCQAAPAAANPAPQGETETPPG